MSDFSTTTFPTQIVVTCGLCDGTNDVKWFCKSCATSMCNTCKISHLKITAFKNHVIVPRTNDVMRLYGPSKIAEQCSLHPDKEISIYCKDCQEPCCVTCLVQKHEGHKISSIEDAYLSAEKRLNENAKELEKDVIPTLDKMTDETKKNRSEKIKMINEAIDEVNEFRIEMKHAVDLSCDSLLNILDQNEIEFDNLIKRIDAQKRKVREMIKGIEEIIQKGNLSMIRYFPLSPKTLIPDVSIPKLTVPVFTPGREILNIIRDRLGAIEWIDRTSDPRHTASQVTRFDPSMIYITKVRSFTSYINASSITIAGNNTAWVMAYVSDTIYLYDSSGKKTRSIKVKDNVGINDMVVRRSGEMIVTCQDGKVRRISVSGEVSTLIDRSSFQPEGVCLTDSEDVVVCMRCQSGRDHVTVYSHDTCRKLREIRGIDDQGKQHITYPYRVVSNGKDMCVVNGNPNKSNVVCVDERGDMRWMYDGKEAKLSIEFNPMGISVDKYNNLLVTDHYNHCVHYIDREGRLIQIILTQNGLTFPWGICVDDKTGEVWVGNCDLRSRTVVVSKYLS